jgi:hypothetical protein
MQDGREEQGEDLGRTVSDYTLSRRLATVGWGLFLVWIGVVRLADLPAGAGLLGVGLITLGLQGARSFITLPLEGFWVVAGIIFTASGLLKLVGTDFPMFPVLFVVAGVLCVFIGIRGKKGKRRSSSWKERSDG